jgi:hypothetical protein
LHCILKAHGCICNFMHYASTSFKCYIWFEVLCLFYLECRNMLLWSFYRYVNENKRYMWMLAHTWFIYIKFTTACWSMSASISFVYCIRWNVAISRLDINKGFCNNTDFISIYTHCWIARDQSIIWLEWWTHHVSASIIVKLFTYIIIK